MATIQTAEIMKKLNARFLDERGFSFEYFQEKGGDSACVYICRFRKGKNYFDLREPSGRYELNLMVYANGQYFFPSLKTLFPKEYRAFRWKHLFSKATVNDHRAWVAQMLEKEWNSPKPDFFGIKK